MAGNRKEIAPELVARGRWLYENTLTPTREIAAMMGLSRNTFDNRVCEWGWVRRKYVSGGAAAADAPRDVVAASVSEQTLAAVQAAVPPSTPVKLPADFAARLQRIIHGEFDVAERILKALNPTNDAEAERTSRTLATVSRTVQEIQATANSAGATPPDETDDDPVPRDIDEFRLALARRIRGFIENRRNSADRLSGDAEAELG